MCDFVFQYSALILSRENILLVWTQRENSLQHTILTTAASLPCPSTPILILYFSFLTCWSSICKIMWHPCLSWENFQCLSVKLLAFRNILMMYIFFGEYMIKTWYVICFHSSIFHCIFIVALASVFYLFWSCCFLFLLLQELMTRRNLQE